MLFCRWAKFILFNEYNVPLTPHPSPPCGYSRAEPTVVVLVLNKVHSCAHFNILSFWKSCAFHFLWKGSPSTNNHQRIVWRTLKVVKITNKSFNNHLVTTNTRAGQRHHRPQSSGPAFQESCKIYCTPSNSYYLSLAWMYLDTKICLDTSILATSNMN
jgi:hypothetical protein